ncbi:MAG: hypothetical protein ACLVIY_01510 [Anaerobutyricum soehngenii]
MSSKSGNNGVYVVIPSMVLFDHICREGKKQNMLSLPICLMVCYRGLEG